MDGLDQLLHEHVVDFFGVHALEGQVKVPDHSQQGRLVDPHALSQEELDEGQDVFIDFLVPLRQVPVNYNQIPILIIRWCLSARLSWRRTAREKRFHSWSLGDPLLKTVPDTRAQPIWR